jgi:hypothetical protein
MDKNKKLYKVVIEERISTTAYIFAVDKIEARRKAIEDEIDSRSNQDFEQSVLKINRVSSNKFPLGIIFNE